MGEIGTTQSICDQVLELESDTDKTAALNFVLAQRWETRNLQLGLGVVLISGIVTVLGAVAALRDGELHVVTQPVLTLSSTILASITAVLGSILTFLKPAERASRYREFGNKNKSLHNRLKIYRTVSIGFVENEKKQHDDLQTFLKEKDALNLDNPPIPSWAKDQVDIEIERKRENKKKDRQRQEL